MFLCPICAHPGTLPDAGDVDCPDCRYLYPVDSVAPIYRTLGPLWRPDDLDVEEAARRVFGGLSAARPIDDMNVAGLRVALSDGVLVAVVAGPWTGALELGVLNVLLKLTNYMETKVGATRVALVAPRPLPASLRYIFSSTPQGRFERLAIGQSGRYQVQVPIDPKDVDGLTSLAGQLLHVCFEGEASGTMEDVPALEQLVLHRLRYPAEPSETMPAGGYTPISSLLLLGLLVGQSIRKAAHSPAAWEVDPQEYFGLGMSTYIRSIGSRGVARVIGKMFKLYMNGSEDSIDALARHVVEESRVTS